MDTKKLEERKIELETEFNKLQSQKKAIVDQVNAFTVEMKRIAEKQLVLQGSYAEICKLLGIDPKDESKLSLKPEKVDKAEDK